ncbi:MAG: PAS domain S-box protein [Fimbriimonadales bacterium]|nr:PAS domain S-box protein [Fimbriimonadales bacterium]
MQTALSLDRKPLSKRETAVLELAAQGKTDKEIARLLGIQVATVGTHWSRIRLKLNVGSRTEAVSVVQRQRASQVEASLRLEREALLGTIASQQTVQAELRRLVQRHRHMFERIPALIAATDPSGLLLDANRRWLHRLGHDLSEVLHRPLGSFLYGPDASETIHRALRFVAEGGSVVGQPCRVRCADGSVFEAQFDADATTDPEGQEWVLFGFIDVSERNRLKAALAHEIERSEHDQAVMGSLFDILPVGIAVFGPAGDFRLANKAFEALWGPEPVPIGEDVHNLSDFVVIDPATGAKVEREQWPVLRALRGGRAEGREYKIYALNGRMKPVWMAADPVWSASGQLVSVVASFVDLSEVHHLRRSIDRLNELETSLRNLVRRLPVLLLAMDEHGRLVLWNEAAERETGFTFGDLLEMERPMERLFPDPATRASMIEEWSRNPNFRARVWPIRAKDGRMRPVAWTNLSGIVKVEGWASVLCGVAAP